MKQRTINVSYSRTQHYFIKKKVNSFDLHNIDNCYYQHSVPEDKFYSQIVNLINQNKQNNFSLHFSYIYVIYSYTIILFSTALIKIFTK